MSRLARKTVAKLFSRSDVKRASLVGVRIEGSDRANKTAATSLFGNDSDREIAIRRVASNALTGWALIFLAWLFRSLSLFDRTTDFGGSREMVDTSLQHALSKGYAFVLSPSSLSFLFHAARDTNAFLASPKNFRATFLPLSFSCNCNDMYKTKMVGHLATRFCKKFVSYDCLKCHRCGNVSRFSLYYAWIPSEKLVTLWWFAKTAWERLVCVYISI